MISNAEMNELQMSPSRHDMPCLLHSDTPTSVLVHYHIPHFQPSDLLCLCQFWLEQNGLHFLIIIHTLSPQSNELGGDDLKNINDILCACTAPVEFILIHKDEVKTN